MCKFKKKQGFAFAKEQKKQDVLAEFLCLALVD